MRSLLIFTFFLAQLFCSSLFRPSTAYECMQLMAECVVIMALFIAVYFVYSILLNYIEFGILVLVSHRSLSSKPHNWKSMASHARFISKNKHILHPKYYSCIYIWSCVKTAWKPIQEHFPFSFWCLLNVANSLYLSLSIFFCSSSFIVIVLCCRFSNENKSVVKYTAVWSHLEKNKRN